MAGTLSPVAWQTFLDASGNPVSGGKLYTYAAGTSTPATTYSDYSLSTPNANPIILDSAGRCVIYLPAAAFKYSLYDSSDVLIRTQDNVPSTALASSVVGADLVFLGGDPNSPVTATSYASGSTWAACAAGSTIVSIDSNNLYGTFALRGMLKTSAGTITAALVNLSDGSPDTPLVTIQSTSTVGEAQVSAGITFAAGGTPKNYGLKVKVSSGFGFVWNCTLERLS